MELFSWRSVLLYEAIAGMTRVFSVLADGVYQRFHYGR